MSDLDFHRSFPEGAIFDMDGVLIYSNPFHLRKWVELLNDHGIPFDPEELPQLVLGQRNDTAFRYFFGRDLSPEKTALLGEELEEKFRNSFRPHARPLPGLANLLKEFHRAEIPLAVASSAMAKNIEFIVDVLGFRPYFRCLVSGDEVTHPKPDPEIYLKAAAGLGCEPLGCIAFEDSFVGIEAAKRAGMKCVAIASTFPLSELEARSGADRTVTSFEELNLELLRTHFSGPAPTPS
jgi:HAD superfamily hydrolase (TIGR01509 family)